MGVDKGGLQVIVKIFVGETCISYLSSSYMLCVLLGSVRIIKLASSRIFMAERAVS